jgi:pyridoxine kinase
VEALEANGWLANLDAVVTRFLPSAGHVALATKLVRRLSERTRTPSAIADPTLGDTPCERYVPQ